VLLLVAVDRLGCPIKMSSYKSLAALTAICGHVMSAYLSVPQFYIYANGKRQGMSALCAGGCTVGRGVGN
jgi:hypothetical protein